jgi:hypothetical protein
MVAPCVFLVGAENLRHLGRCSADHSWIGPAFGCRAGRCRFVWRWDDLRLVGLKLIFLIVSRAVSVLGLSRRESWWKDAEILMLRHQLAVAQRERPRARSRLTWPDRAWLALLAGTPPVDRLAAMHLIVTPGTIMRWHRDIVRRRWARVPHRRSGRPPVHRNVRAVCGAAAGGGERVLGLTADPRRACRTGHRGDAVHGRADPQERRDRSGAPPGWPGLGGVPAVPGAGDPGAGLPAAKRPAEARRTGRGRTSSDRSPGQGPVAPRRPGRARRRAPGPPASAAAPRQPPPASWQCAARAASRWPARAGRRPRRSGRTAPVRGVGRPRGAPEREVQQPVDR